MKDLKRSALLILSVVVAQAFLLTACKQSNEPGNSNPVSSKKFKVIGYLYDKQANIEKLPYEYLTDINYSFALPTPDSTGNIMPVPFPDTLTRLVATAHAHGVKVFISIGGWDLGDGGGNDTRYEVLAASQPTRTTFVNSAMGLVRKFNLDGIDIDWEYPQTIEPSSTNFVLLMKQLSDSLHTAGKQLSAAIVAFDDLHGYGIKKEVFQYVDWMNLMAYDYKDEETTPHSPYWVALRSLEYWVDNRGLSKEKAMLGLNFGFYRYLLRMGASPYADSYVTHLNFFRHGNENKAKADKLDTLYYNGITTIKEKTRLAKEKGAGIMIWAIASDTSGQYSLLKAIHDAANEKD